MKERRPSRWILPAILIGIYLFLKLQGWMYSRRVMDLERQLDELRPALSAKVLLEQMESTRSALGQVIEKTERSDLNGSELLQQISRRLPPSVTLRRLQIRTDREFQMQGVCLPGVRSPEQLVVALAQKLQAIRPGIRIQEIFPSAQIPGGWEFELRAEGPEP